MKVSGQIELKIEESDFNNGISKKFNAKLSETKPKLYEFENKSDSIICGWMSKSRIVGGKETERGQYPWMAAIYRPEWDDLPICGGVVLNNQFLMTAAHCFYHKIRKSFMNLKIFTIRLGAHTFNGQNEVEARDYLIDKLKVHQKFDPKLLLNDIAIIKLKPKIEFTKFIRPICLPYNMTDNLEGKDVIAAGWGLTQDNGEQSEKLLDTDLKIISNEKCAHIYSNHFLQVYSSMLCTFAPGKDSCHMDSGGPVMIKNENKIWSVVGIISFGDECASEKYPAVNTKVSYYINWIEESIQSML